MTRGTIRAATLVVAVVLDLVTFGTAGTDRMPWNWFDQVPGMSAALDAQASFSEGLLARDDVVGTAIGIGADGRAALLVLTSNPFPLDLPANFAGTPVMTQYTGRFVGLGDLPKTLEDATPNPAASFPRPVPIGVSAGQVDVTAGTIGARVRSGSQVFALSNNHVFANRNRANKGDNILQPGRVDGGVNPSDAIGTLYDFEPIAFCAGGLRCPENTIDAAIALTTVDDLGTETPNGGYGAPRSKTAKATLGLRVQKYGRTTGHTHGKITGINATIDVGFQDGVARFTGQIVITGGGFSAPGDSGSLIVTEGSGGDDRRPVGLLFAGSQTSTLANPIDVVLDRFNIRIDDGTQ